MNKTLIWAVVGVLVLGGGYYLLQNKISAPAADGAIKIGFIGPLTGSFSENGDEARNAFMLAVDNINAQGGILGKQISPIAEDGKCDPTATINAWHKLVDADAVKIILGGHCSSETLALAPLASSSHVLALANITSAVKIPNEGDWLFRNSPPSSYIAVKAADYVVNVEGRKRIGVISEIKEFPRTYTQIFNDTAKKDGAEIVYNEEFNPDTNDFRTILTKIKSQKVDAVLVSTQSGETAGIIARQMHDLGVTVPQIYNAGFNVPSFEKGSAGFTPKDVTVITGYADPASPNVQKFVNSYKAKFHQDVAFNLYYISAVYDMVFRVKDAMEQCKSDQNIDCVRGVFKNATSYNGVSGQVQVNSVYSPSSTMMPLGKLVINSDGTFSVVGLEAK